jgi:aspartyl-tRNA synthetase
MNQQAQDLMMGAPAPVAAKHLRELHIRTVVPEAPKPQAGEPPKQ